jgi:hypothetical protein
MTMRLCKDSLISDGHCPVSKSSPPSQSAGTELAQLSGTATVRPTAVGMGLRIVNSKAGKVQGRTES